MSVRDDLVGSFRWIDGHADVWRWFADGELLARIVAGLAEPFRDVGVTIVAGLEARGFLLAGAVAKELETGVVGVRKEGGPLPGARTEAVTSPDYRGRRLRLAMQSDPLSDGDSVLLVDDWIETGSQALAAQALIEETGAGFAGFAVIVRDRTSAEVEQRLQPFHALVDAEAFGASDALPSNT